MTVVERLPAIGGRARVFRQDGFTFDAGPTVITAPQLFEELFALFGERMSDHVDLLPVRPWYRILFADGRHFEYGSSAEEMREAVAAFAPRDLAGYDRLMQRSREIYEVGFDQLGAQPFHTARSMLRALPAIIRLGGYKSVSALVGSFSRATGRLEGAVLPRPAGRRRSVRVGCAGAGRGDGTALRSGLGRRVAERRIAP